MHMCNVMSNTCNNSLMHLNFKARGREVNRTGIRGDCALCVCVGVFMSRVGVCEVGQSWSGVYSAVCGYV